MAKGKVKWFNNAKGYGFILSDSGGDDLFAHYSSIQMSGYKTLKAGQPVEFEIQKGTKGFHAVNIQAAADGATADISTSDHSTSDMDDSLLDHPTPSEHTPAEPAERETRIERARPHSVLAESG